MYVEGISILNDLRGPNCDGIDVDHCRRVRIANYNIQAGDDCIILKTSRNFTRYGPCEDITVTGCTLTSSSAGIKIEPEGPETIRNATITSCVISHSNRGVCLLNRDGALIEDLVFSDLVITTELAPFDVVGSGRAGTRLKPPAQYRNESRHREGAPVQQSPVRGRERSLYSWLEG